MIEECPFCKTKTLGQEMFLGVLFWCPNCKAQWEEGRKSVVW